MAVLELRVLSLLILLFHALAVAGNIQKIKIGIAANFSEIQGNTYNPFGFHLKKGIETAFHHYGPAFKSRFEFEFFDIDYGASALKAKEKAEWAVTQKPTLVIGFEFSEEALLAAPVFEQARIPLLSPSASSNQLEVYPGHFFPLCFSNEYQAKQVFLFATRRYKPKKVLIATAQDCAYCQNLSDTFLSLAARAHLTTDLFPFLSSDTVFTFPKTLSIEGYDLAIVPNHELASARIVRELLRLGFKKPFFGGDSWRTLNDIYKDPALSHFVGFKTALWKKEGTDKLSRQFLNHFESSAHESPNNISALSHDAALLLFEGLKLHKGTVTPAGLSRTLKKIKHLQGVTGRFVFVKDQVFPRKTLYLLRSSPGGFVLEREIPPDVF